MSKLIEPRDPEEALKLAIGFFFSHGQIFIAAGLQEALKEIERLHAIADRDAAVHQVMEALEWETL